MWIAALVVIVICGLGLARPPKARMTDRRVQFAPTIRRVGGKLGGPTIDKVLAVSVHASSRGGLQDCFARLTYIAPSPPHAPLRLVWTPSGNQLASIPPGGEDAIEIARISAGVAPTMLNPDHSLPYGLMAGTYDFVMQVAADDYVADRFAGKFIVINDPPLYDVDWVSFNRLQPSWWTSFKTRAYGDRQ
jgi:hypothetical protein